MTIRGIVLALACVGAGACDQAGEFPCGTHGSDGKSIRTCANPNEVCVCATNSCAKRVLAATCDGGLQYLGDPWSAAGLEGQCVPAAERTSAIDQTVQQLCTTTPFDAGLADAGTPDAAGDAQ